MNTTINILAMVACLILLSGIVIVLIRECISLANINTHLPPLHVFDLERGKYYQLYKPLSKHHRYTYLIKNNKLMFYTTDYSLMLEVQSSVNDNQYIEVNVDPDKLKVK